MTPPRTWLAAARPGDALVVPLCAAVGSSYAYFDAQRGPGLAAHGLVTLGAFAAGLGINLVDHFWGLLSQPPPATPAAPGSPAPPDPSTAAAAAGVAIALAALCGFGLVPLSGAGPLAYGALAVALGAVRTAPLVGPSALGWPLGEVALLVVVGPLAAMAGYASQARSASLGSLLAGIPAGLVAAAALFARHAPRRDRDVRLERQIAVALPLLAAAAVAVTVGSGEYGAWARAAMLPLAVAAVAAWQATAAARPSGDERWARLALACGVAGLVVIIAALRIAAHG